MRPALNAVNRALLEIICPTCPDTMTGFLTRSGGAMDRFTRFAGSRVAVELYFCMSCSSVAVCMHHLQQGKCIDVAFIPV